MVLALSPFTWVHFALLAMRDFAIAHIVWAIPVVLVVAIVMVPGFGLTVLSFLRTAAGRLVVTCLVAGIGGWEARAYVDSVAALRREAVASVREAEAARAGAQAATRAAAARVAELTRQIDAAQSAAIAAHLRAVSAETAVDTYRKREEDYEAALDKADHETPGPGAAGQAGRDRPAGACTLDDADLRGLRRAAGAYDERGASHPAGRTGRLRAPRRRP